MPASFPDIFLLATSSAGKAEEFRAMLDGHGLQSSVKTYADFGLSAPDETGTAFVENCRIKAVAGCDATSLTTLADDSGLCVPALDDAPGVYSADWAEDAQGNRDFTRAMARIDKELGDKDRAAYFICVLILRDVNGEEIMAQGKVHGRLLPAGEGRGSGGHGYDAWFMPEGFETSFGEMSVDQKNSLSHRARAFKDLMSQF